MFLYNPIQNAIKAVNEINDNYKILINYIEFIIDTWLHMASMKIKLSN